MANLDMHNLLKLVHRIMVRRGGRRTGSQPNQWYLENRGAEMLANKDTNNIHKKR